MSMVLGDWDEQAGDWRPDEWDQRVRAVIERRDRVADSVVDPPVFGSPEWAAADERTQAASQARHERAAAEARGREISDRMARESAERAARVEAAKQMSAGLAGLPRLPRDVVERREQDREWRKTQPRPSDLVPAQRDPKERLQPDGTAEAVRRARAACREIAARRVATPVTPVTRGRATEQDDSGRARV